jgi:hypothetical protein
MKVLLTGRQAEKGWDRCRDTPAEMPGKSASLPLPVILFPS